MKMFTMFCLLFSSVTFANECADLSKCVEFVSKLTGKKYLYEGKLKGELQTSSNLQMTSENADNLFTYILSVNGYARVPTIEKDTYKIVEARDIRYQTTPTIHVDKDSTLQVPNTEDYYFMIYKFKNYQHGQLRQVSNSLRPFMSRYGRIIETSDLLSVQEVASKLSVALDFAKKFDRELSKEEIKKWEESEKERKDEKRKDREEERKLTHNEHSKKLDNKNLNNSEKDESTKN
jgi:hypothetical protein